MYHVNQCRVQLGTNKVVVVVSSIHYYSTETDITHMDNSLFFIFPSILDHPANIDHQTNQSGRSKRSLHESQGKPRGERDVIRLRNPTEDKRAFRRRLTSADRVTRGF